MRHIPQFSLLTFYKFVDIPQATALTLVDEQWEFTQDIGLRGRVYIGVEGISATVTGNVGQLNAYRTYLDSISYFQNIPDIDAKSTPVEGHQFEKMLVKYREEIVTLGEKVRAAEVAAHKKELSPEQFKAIIDSGSEEYLIVDMRNDYEYRLGHFKGAIPAGTVSFREVPKLLERYKEAAKTKKIVWYCTGGIRCEKAAVIMNKAGFSDVYSLEGGVVKYTNAHNDGNWLGNLYTFDGRISTQIGDTGTHTTIGECLYSGKPTDNVENCRYAACNARLIADHEEYRDHGGFCSYECFTNAKSDGLVKNVEWDKFDYRQTMRSAKRLTELGDISGASVLKTSLHDHLEKKYGKVLFNHTVSQKEEVIMMD